jgi:hypothetical protein
METKPGASSGRLVRAATIALIVVASGMVLFNMPRESNTSTNVMSRWATVEALVDHGTYAIDDTKYSTTIDKVQIDGRLYSSKPPLLPTLVAGVYAVYRALTGDEIGTRNSRATWVCKAFTVFVWYVLLLVYFVKSVQLLVRRPEAQVLAMVAMTFGWIGAGYATTLNNHTPAALLALMTFYHALRAHGWAPSGEDAASAAQTAGGAAMPGSAAMPGATRHWIAAGLTAGAIPAFDLPLGALSAGVFVYLFAFDRRRTLRIFLPAVAPTLLLHLILTWAVTGSIVPVYLRGELYRYPGSYWATPHGVYALDQPKWLYAFHLFFGHHGFFTMTPLLLLAAWALIGLVRNRQPGRAEALLVGIVGLVLFVFYVFRTSNYGGRCVGMRWLIPYAPLLLLFLGAWLDRLRRYSLEICTLLVVLFLVSQFNALDALHAPWQESHWHDLWRRILGADY